VRSSRAARRILESVSWTRLQYEVRQLPLNEEGSSYQISRLLRRPYSPASFNSASKRAASKGLHEVHVSIYSENLREKKKEKGNSTVEEPHKSFSSLLRPS
jgi:hypothetical protein